jgi:hypothetical protein
MDDFHFEFRLRLQIFDAPAPWYFFELPEKEAAYIRKEFRDVHRGWGSIPVIAQIGDTTWKTSIFWEKKGSYLLFVKKDVRQKEKITNGDFVKLKIELKP